jgi:hypothetical protein
MFPFDFYHKLPFCRWENWGPERQMTCPRSHSMLKLGPCDATPMFLTNIDPPSLPRSSSDVTLTTCLTLKFKNRIYISWSSMITKHPPWQLLGHHHSPLRWAALSPSPKQFVTNTFAGTNNMVWWRWSPELEPPLLLFYGFESWNNSLLFPLGVFPYKSYESYKPYLRDCRGH